MNEGLITLKQYEPTERMVNNTGGGGCKGKQTKDKSSGFFMKNAQHFDLVNEMEMYC